MSNAERRCALEKCLEILDSISKHFASSAKAFLQFLFPLSSYADLGT